MSFAFSARCEHFRCSVNDISFIAASVMTIHDDMFVFPRFACPVLSRSGAASCTIARQCLLRHVRWNAFLQHCILPSPGSRLLVCVMRDTLTMLRRLRLHCMTYTEAQLSSHGGPNGLEDRGLGPRCDCQREEVSGRAAWVCARRRENLNLGT